MSYEAHHRKMRTQIKELNKTQEKAIKGLFKRYQRQMQQEVVTGALKGEDYNSMIERFNAILQGDLNNLIRSNIELVAKQTLEPEYQLFRGMQSYKGNEMMEGLNILQLDVVANIINGNLYSDKRTLSERLWRSQDRINRNIQLEIANGILLGSSEQDLAKKLERYLIPIEEREPDTVGYVDPSYAARRLARTSVSHAYQTTTVRNAQMNPYTHGIRWRSAGIHGRTCKICMDRHNKLYDPEYVPLDHPNGLCTYLPENSKSLDEIADDLSRWVKGEENSMLDGWYDNLTAEQMEMDLGGI